MVTLTQTEIPLKAENIISVTVCINYGDGQSTTLPVTVSSNTTALDATEQATNNGAIYTGSGSTLTVTAINGITAEGTNLWSLWTWNSGSNQWVLADVNADSLTLTNGEVFCWFLTSNSPWPPTPPPAFPWVQSTILIDFGNGIYYIKTVTINDRATGEGDVKTNLGGDYASVFDTMLATCKSVGYSKYGGTLGNFINTIDGVAPPDDGSYWSFWWQNTATTEWSHAQYGCSSTRATNITAWRLGQGGDQTPHAYPTTGLTVSCSPNTVSKTTGSTTISGGLTGTTQTWQSELKNWTEPVSTELSGRVVTLYGAPVGSSSWVQIGQVSTGSDGSYAYTWTPDDSFADGSYQVEAVFDGDSQNLGSSAQTSVSVAGSLASATPAPTSTVAATPVSTVAPSQADTLTPSPTVPEFSVATLALLVVLASSAVVAVFRIKKSKISTNEI